MATEINTLYTKLSALQSISYRQSLTCSLGKIMKQNMKVGDLSFFRSNFKKLIITALFSSVTKVESLKVMAD